MSVTTLPYNLPDAYLFDGAEDGYHVWQPQKYYLVLGQSNTPERSLFTDKVLRSGIPVTKRPTGGEAVMLTPLTVVFTVAKTFSVPISSRDYFSIINTLIVEYLRTKGVTNLGFKGISDITIGDKKILGSAMRSLRSKMIYHAVLNVSEDPDLFENYLRHPIKEPDYRAQRSHHEFVTSLKTEGFNIIIDELICEITQKFYYYLSRP